MRILFKLAMKLVFLAVVAIVLSGVVRYGMQRFHKTGSVGGVTGVANASAEESGLMTTVLQSALRLLSGEATRDELSNDLTKKLYGARADSTEMKELGIELVKPGGEPLTAAPAGGNAKSDAGAAKLATTAGQPLIIGSPDASKEPAAKPVTPDPAMGKLALVWERLKVCSVELIVIPVVFLGMWLWSRARRKAMASDFVPPMVAIPGESDSEPYEMIHAVHALSTEDFELLIALIYQRQGYRVSMPAGMSGGRGGDFTLQKKGERVLVQCKRLNVDHRVSVERVREFYEAMTTAGIARGMYVASCGFTWDARNFAKTRGITLINARTLDEVIIAARSNPDENLLEVSAWLSTFAGKVTLTAPTCPACEAGMEEVYTSHNSVWLCRHRPECRGRRCGRKFRKGSAPEKKEVAGVLVA